MSDGSFGCLISEKLCIHLPAWYILGLISSDIHIFKALLDAFELLGSCHYLILFSVFFFSFNPAVMEGTRDVTPTVLKTSTGLEGVYSDFFDMVFSCT